LTITLVDDGALEEHQGLSLFVAQRRLLDGESGQVAVAAHLEGDGAMLGRGGHVLQRGLEVRAVVLHGLGVEGDGGVGGAVRADLHARRLHLVMSKENIPYNLYVILVLVYVSFPFSFICI